VASRGKSKKPTSKPSKNRLVSIEELDPEIILGQMKYLLENPEAAGDMKLDTAVWLTEYAGAHLVLSYDDPQDEDDLAAEETQGPHPDWAAQLATPDRVRIDPEFPLSPVLPLVLPSQ